MVIQIHIKVIYTNAKLKKTRDKAINIKAINIKATNIKSRKINYIQNHIIHDMCSRWKAHVNHDMSFTTVFAQYGNYQILDFDLLDLDLDLQGQDHNFAAMLFKISDKFCLWLK